MTESQSATFKERLRQTFVYKSQVSTEILPFPDFVDAVNKINGINGKNNLADVPFVYIHLNPDDPLVVVNKDYFANRLGEDFSDLIHLEIGFHASILWDHHNHPPHINFSNHSMYRKKSTAETLNQAKSEGLLEKYIRFKELSLPYNVNINPFALDDIDNMYEFYSQILSGLKVYSEPKI